MAANTSFFDALKFQPLSRPPHFEQTFEICDEAFGIDFPKLDEHHRDVERFYDGCAAVYERIIREFDWDALLIWNPADDLELTPGFIRYFKRHYPQNIPVGTFIWQAVYSIDSMKGGYEEFAIDLYENPSRLHENARGLVRAAKEKARRYVEAGADFLEVGSDVAFNKGPFIAARHFSQFVTPYLQEIIGYIRDRLHVPCMFHSDGNLIPILDQIMSCKPDLLQSIDPMAGMDIAEVKKLTYGKLALMGNVRCDALQTGPAAEIRTSAEYCLLHGAPGGGFVYSSSNTIFKGVPLRNYRLMLDVYHEMFA